MYTIILERDEDLQHYGTKRHSGRYPYGSGERPFQGEVTRREYKDALNGKDRSALTRERTIKAGTTMYRTTNKTEDANGPIYVTYLQPDRAYYRSTYVNDLAKYENLDLNKDKVYENTYILKEDLRIPNRKDAAIAKFNVISRNPDLRAKIFDEKVRQRLLNIKDKKFSDFTETDIEEYKRAARPIINALHSDSGIEQLWALDALTTSKTFQQELAKELSSKGYNAMVDELGVGGKYSINEGGRREGIDPLIIFDSSILSKESVDTIGEKDFDYYNKESVKNEEKRNKYDRAGIGKWSLI